MINKNTIVRHHLLEIILWPNEDGTFRTIHNSMDRLKELGIYDDYKMAIPLTVSEHIRLHRANMSEEHRQKMSESHKGRTFSDEHRKKLSEAHKGKTWKLVNRKRVWIEKEENHG